ncbi:hypothetical protein RQP46_003096 [Phenoliferia psychrophenolica]
METTTIYGTPVSIAFFSNLTNAPEIRARLVAASTLPDDPAGVAERAAVAFAFLDAQALTSRLHLLTAISQALLAEADDSLVTKTVQSEVLFSLEPGTAINDSLRHFGLSAATKALVLVHFAPRGTSAVPVNEEEVFGKMKDVVQGELASLDLLGTDAAGVNVKTLRKLYKLNQDAVLAGVKAGSEAERSIVNDLCSSAVAMKVVA